MIKKDNWTIESSNTNTNKPMFFIDNMAYEQHKELGLVYKSTSHDQELTRFFNDLKDPSTYSTQITIMARVKGFDKEGKQKEYLTWTETLQGLDKDGNTITISDIPCGQTQELYGIQYHEGQPIPASYPSKTRYTVEFSKQDAQKLIDKSQFSDSIQFIVKGLHSFGGFTKDEFLGCSFTELDTRGRLGVAGLYSHLQQVQPPPQQYQVITPK